MKFVQILCNYILFLILSGIETKYMFGFNTPLHKKTQQTKQTPPSPPKKKKKRKISPSMTFATIVKKRLQIIGDLLNHKMWFNFIPFPFLFSDTPLPFSIQVKTRRQQCPYTYTTLPKLHVCKIQGFVGTYLICL